MCSVALWAFSATYFLFEEPSLCSSDCREGERSLQISEESDDDDQRPATYSHIIINILYTA